MLVASAVASLMGQAKAYHRRKPFTWPADPEGIIEKLSREKQAFANPKLRKGRSLRSPPASNRQSQQMHGNPYRGVRAVPPSSCRKVTSTSIVHLCGYRAAISQRCIWFQNV